MNLAYRGILVAALLAWSPRVSAVVAAGGLIIEGGRKFAVAWVLAAITLRGASAQLFTLSGQNYLGKVNPGNGDVESFARIDGIDGNFKGLACGIDSTELYGIKGGDNLRIVKIVEASDGSGLYETKHVVSIPKAEQLQPDPNKLLPHAAAVDPTHPRFIYVTNSDERTKRLWRIDLLGQAPFESFDLTGGRRDIEGQIEDVAFSADGTLYGITRDLFLYDIDKNRPLSPTLRPPVRLFTALSDFPDSKAMAIFGDDFLYTVSNGTNSLQVTEFSLSNIITTSPDPSNPLVPAPVDIGPTMLVTEEVTSATFCQGASSGPDVEEPATIQCSNFVHCDNGFLVGSRNQITCEKACLATTLDLRTLHPNPNDATSNCCYGTHFASDYPCKGFTGKVCADEGQKSCYAVDKGLDQVDADPSSLQISRYACLNAKIGEIVNGCIGFEACLRVGRPLGGMVGGVGKIKDACIGNNSCQLMASDNTRGHYCPVIDEVISSCNVVRGCSFLAWGGNGSDNSPYKGSVRRIVYSCNAYNACENALMKKNTNLNIDEINGSCNRPLACIGYSQNDDLVCECLDFHWQNADYISRDWAPPHIYCQAYASPAPDDPCLNPDGSVGICGEGTCGSSSPPPPTCSALGPVEDPALLPGGGAETIIGEDEGMPSGVIHTYNIPYLSHFPQIIWRLESAFLTMDGNPSHGNFLMNSCNRDELDPHLIVCIGHVAVGLEGDTFECRLHIRLVWSTPIDVEFNIPDVSSTTPYLDVTALVEFTAQIELYIHQNGQLYPARQWFNNLSTLPPGAVYDADVKMAFFYEPMAFPVTCPDAYPSSLDCVAADEQYFALDRSPKTWKQHREHGSLYGFSLVVAGEDDESDENVRVKMALNALNESIEIGVWFAGRYNADVSLWQYPDGSTMGYDATPTVGDDCAFYEKESAYGWANDSCNEEYMAIFEIPSYSFRMSGASSGVCQLPTVRFDQTGSMVRLSLTDPTDGSTENETFSIAQTITMTPTNAVGTVLLGVEVNGEETQTPLEISTDDADANPTNEIQDLFVVQDVPGKATLKLTDPSDPSAEYRSFSVDIMIDDADADPGNEFQTLIVGSNPVGSAILNLADPSGLGPTSAVTISTNDPDADPSNEIQRITDKTNADVLGSATIEISDPSPGGSPSTVTINTNDADADPANELQSLDLAGKKLSILRGNFVDLTPLDKLTLPFYVSVGQNKQKNVFGHPFGGTSFAAPYYLAFDAYSVLVTRILPPGCNLEVHVDFNLANGTLIQSMILGVNHGTDSNAGPYGATTEGQLDPLIIPQRGKISVTSVGTTGKCNGMNSESATVLLVFRVLNEESISACI